MKTIPLYILSLVFIVAILFSCEEKTEIADMSLSAEVSKLVTPDEGTYYYRLYLQNGEDYTYVTEVEPGLDSTWSTADVEVDPIRLADAQQILIVVSSSATAAAQPDGPTILAADFSGVETVLSIGHSEAIGDPFRTQSGAYYLYTPSAIDTTEWYRGIWMYDTTTLDTFSLLLPEINEGWVYEGWIEVNELDTFISIGRWSLNDEDDSADPFISDELDPFPFPGEDFIQNLPTGLMDPFDLRGRRIIITLEPADDPQLDRPFPLIVLEDDLIGGPFPEQLKVTELIPKRNFPTGAARR